MVTHAKNKKRMGIIWNNHKTVNSKVYSVKVFLDKIMVKKQSIFEKLTLLLVVNSLLYKALNTQS